MKKLFLPQTRLGKWSIYTILGFLVCLTVFFFFIHLGERGGDTFFSNMTLAVPFCLAALSGVTSFITGLISIIRQKERSIPVFLSSAMGAFVLFFISAEILFPH